MSEIPPQGLESTSVADVEVKRRRAPSLVWLIPAIAALIGAGIAFETIMSKGPTVTLTFADGSGLDAGKTKVKYRAIEVGVVTRVELSDDFESVIATAELDKGMERHLTENTIFWKVSPHISLTSVSGLGTLVSGQYISMLPRPGKPAREFQVLAAPPLTAEHRNALGIELVADALGSISAGSPVTYRSIAIGEVEKYEIIEDGRRFRIHVLINRPYVELVKKGTQFWNASGLDVSVGLDGVQVHTASLASLLEGGIALDTPPWAEKTPAAESGDQFALYSSFRAAVRARERVEGLNVVVEGRDGSIAEGAPVYYRKHKVGHVGRNELSADATSVRYQVHIDQRYATLVRSNSRFWNASGVNLHLGIGGLDLRTDSLESILEGGLEFATPDRPGPQAEAGALYALHDQPDAKWLAWAPKIWLSPDGKKRAVAHVLPAARAQPRGLEIVLESFELASVKAGDAIYYREAKVGEIGEHELSKDARTVRIHARIEPRYATLVRSNSRFWNASGISAHFGLGGLDIQTESLESIMAGGVAFATPDEPGARVKPGTIFPLHPEAKDDWKHWSPAIWIDGGPSGKAVEHAIHEKTHGYLLRRSVQAEAVAPDAQRAGGELPAVASPPNQAGAGVQGFFRRMFGGGDQDEE